MTTPHVHVCRLTGKHVLMARQRNDLDVQIKKLTAERDAIDATLERVLRNHGSYYATFRNQRIIEMQAWERRTIDTKRLKAEKPEIAAQYERVNTGERLHYVS